MENQPDNEHIKDPSPLLEQENAEETPSTKPEKGRAREKNIRPFPMYDIKQALQIPQIIRKCNAGNPWPPQDIARALNLTPKGDPIFYLTSASRAYGFTTGTRQAKYVELAPLGRRFAFASSPTEEAECIKTAFLNVELFKRVFEHYNGEKLPELKYLSNTLQNKFNVSEMYHEDFYKIYTSNLIFLRSSEDAKGKSELTPEIKGTSSGPSHPKENKNNELFVIMPFNEKTAQYSAGFFDEVFNSLIVPAANEAGFTARTANKSGSDIIHSTIVNDILSANIILADLTEHNPNVLFELGLAMALKKKVAIIRAKGTPAIFDVDNMLRVYDYDRNLWKSTIEKDIPNLSSHIIETVKNTGKAYLDLLKSDRIT